jgi:hypothetical protein
MYDNHFNAHGKLRKRIHGSIDKVEHGIKVDLGNIKKAVKNGKVLHEFNRYDPATLAARGAFLSVLGLNLVGIASALGVIKDKNGKHWQDLQHKWWLLGGDGKHFDKEVQKHRNKKHLFEDSIKGFHKKKGVDGSYSASGADNTAGNAVAGAATLLGSAATALTFIPGGQPFVVPTGGAATVTGAMSPIFKSFAKDNGATPDTLAQLDKSTASLPNPLVGKGVLNDDGTSITTSTGQTLTETQEEIIAAIAGIIILGITIKLITKK